MQKIKSTSHVLYLLFSALCWIMPLLIIYFILFDLDGIFNLWSSWFTVISPDQIQNISDFSFLHRLIILGIQFIPLSITILICHKLAQLFKLYEQGYLFEENNIRLIKSVGIYMMLGQLIQLIYQPLISIALTFNNPVGKRLIVMTVSTTNLSTIITALIILVTSWIIKEASQLKTDTQLTI